jgi:hypothetical protein
MDMKSFLFSKKIYTGHFEDFFEVVATLEVTDDVPLSA